MWNLSYQNIKFKVRKNDKSPPLELYVISSKIFSSSSNNFCNFEILSSSFGIKLVHSLLYFIKASILDELKLSLAILTETTCSTTKLHVVSYDAYNHYEKSRVKTVIFEGSKIIVDSLVSVLHPLP